MGKIIMEVSGVDGQVELMDDRVVIHRRGLLNMFKYGINAQREIPLTSISSVNFRDASIFKTGEISFDHAGRSQVDQKQNTVTFTKKHQPGFLLLKEKIFTLMQQNQRK